MHISPISTHWHVNCMRGSCLSLSPPMLCVHSMDSPAGEEVRTSVGGTEWAVYPILEVHFTQPTCQIFHFFSPIEILISSWKYSPSHGTGGQLSKIHIFWKLGKFEKATSERETKDFESSPAINISPKGKHFRPNHVSHVIAAKTPAKGNLMLLSLLAFQNLQSRSITGYVFGH